MLIEKTHRIRSSDYFLIQFQLLEINFIFLWNKSRIFISFLNYRITQEFGYSFIPKVNPFFCDEANTFIGRLKRMYYDHTKEAK